jgi:hypothetical protein
LLFSVETELSEKQQKGIKMWISRKKYREIENRVADLEKSQLRATEMVKEYIEDQNLFKISLYSSKNFSF